VNDVYEVFTRSECLKCGLCCIETEMILLPTDISIIENLGYAVNEFATYWGGYWRLKNVDGHCYFYDPVSGTCKIYKHRPMGCRIYPIIYVEGVGPSIDKDCPLADTITPDEWRRGVELIRMYIKLLKMYYGPST